MKVMPVEFLLLFSLKFLMIITFLTSSSWQQWALYGDNTHI